MKILYQCEGCNEIYNNEYDCRECEMSHMQAIDVLKYKIKWQKRCACDYCDHSFYVYGCECDCGFNDCSNLNGYKDFKPVEPFHNKRLNGGI